VAERERSRRGSTVLVAVAAAVYGAIGVWTLIDPVGALAGVGVQAQGAIGVVEIRAMYGGLELGMAGFLVWCLARGRVEAGLVAATLTIGGLGLTRAIGWAAAGMPPSLHPMLVVVEVSGAAVGLVVWWRELAGET